LKRGGKKTLNTRRKDPRPTWVAKRNARMGKENIQGSLTVGRGESVMGRTSYKAGRKVESAQRNPEMAGNWRQSEDSLVCKRGRVQRACGITTRDNTGETKRLLTTSVAAKEGEEDGSTPLKPQTAPGVTRKEKPVTMESKPGQTFKDREGTRKESASKPFHGKTFKAKKKNVRGKSEGHSNQRKIW